jgi:GT2 family glycosyltransferase
MSLRLLPLSAVGDVHEPLDDATVTGPIRVSVIVRTRDRLELLGEALAALGAQTWRPLEVVLVNDGGAPVDAALTALPEDVEVVHRRLKAAVGRSAAANLGLSLATGDWVGFCDDDDIWLPDGVATLAAAALADSDAVVYGRVGAFHYPEEGGPRRRFRTFGRTFDPDVLLFENFIPIIGCLAPATVVRAAGGVDESLECFEDWDLFLRLADRLPFRFVDAEVAEYRTFGGGFITGAGGQERQDRGRAVLYAKHWQRFTPEVLSRVQHAVKADLLPREVAHELEGWRERVADLEAGIAERDHGIEFLRGQLVATERAVDDAEARCAEVTASLRRAKAADPARFTPVSVVLVNYNGRHHLERCLPSLAATRDVAVETLVVDNGSTDGSLEWLAAHHPEVRVLPMGANLGFGAANRRGIEAASSEYVALLNTDTVVEPDWLRPLLTTLMAEPGIGAACSTLRLMAHSDLLNARGGGMTKLGLGFDHGFGQPADGDAPELAECLFPTAAAVLMRRREFEAVGGFDSEFFMYHEDVDLGWRLWLEGLRVVVVRDSVVRHAFGGTLRRERSLAWRERLGARHDVRSLIKHYELWNLVRSLRGLVRHWRRGRAWGLMAHVAWWNLVRLPSTLGARMRIQRRRRISDSELFDRGLITELPYPPAPPELPRAVPERDREHWIVSPELRPGHHSALGRLGAGWHGPQRVAEDMARPTSGCARCWLKVAPGVRGRVLAEVHVPAEARDGRSVTLTAAEGTVSRPLEDELWQSVDVAASADAEGLVPVDIAVPSWRPHDVFRDWNGTAIGCAVRRILFVPDESPETPPTPKVSVVITTFNRRETLGRTLAALADQTWADLEVVVVDDGSADDTWDTLEREARDGALAGRLTARRQDNTGQGLARNHALGHATGELVLFLGDDVIPAPDLVAAHVARHRTEGSPCAVVGFSDWDREHMAVTPFLERTITEGLQFGYGLMRADEDLPYTCFYTSNLSLPRSVLGEHPFDASFRGYGWEDVELGWRLSLAGLRLVYEPGAKAVHCHPQSLTDFVRRQVQVGRALHSLIALHPELEGEPFMPPPAPSPWTRRVGRLEPMLVPILDRLDRRGVRLPRALVDRLMMAAFFRGKRDGAV